MRDNKILPYRKTIKKEGTSRNYKTTWFCIRRADGETFPDGARVNKMVKWTALKPIWIKLGKGVGWAKAITFGPTKSVMEEAAEDFGAEQIVWLDEKDKRARRDNKKGEA